MTISLQDNPYNQAPLDLKGTEFRLVELQPCSPTDIIKCRLTTHALPPDCPSYTALSYMWDHTSPQDVIELNGIPFPVGHSLWTFLNRMRLHKLFATYWIDAICIDQSNVQERNHQVQMMKYIYSEAQSVSIWLGDAEDGSMMTEAMALLTSLKNNPSLVEDFMEWTPDQAGALLCFYTDAYWDRMWIVQEVTLARQATIYCGSHKLDYSFFKKLMQNQNFQASHRKLFASPAHSLNEMTRLSPTPLSACFHYALLLCRSRKATDARDRIYALLGIVEEEATSSIPVDYTIEVEKLWEVVFSYFCRTRDRTCDLDQLESLGHNAAKALEIGIREERMKYILDTVFLTRPPPVGMREILELPDAPNHKVFFEITPMYWNPKGLRELEESR